MRGSGILMHITSLPGAYGIGTMGKNAFAFVDFLKKAGQHYWQILPLTPTGFGDSPYQSCSTYAGNPYLIDLGQLVEEGLLTEDEPAAVVWNRQESCVDFGLMYAHRLGILRKAYMRFADTVALDAFCRENSSWLEDFALYMALKDAFDHKPWYQWPAQLKHRQPEALRHARQVHRDAVGFHCFVQYVFFRQWTALQSYAHQNQIRIIGDVPIYVPYDCVEVWCNPELFQLDENLDPVAVAGCPPDAFTEDGQLWGNPLYRWDVHKQDNYRWWMHRLSASGKLYDMIRLDHFRGFEAYWSVPYDHTTAKNGKWVKGPGMDFIRQIQTQLPHLPMIAEDLGYLTQEVLDLRDASDFPGMKVLGFAFDSREPSFYLPHTYIQNTVCYTGTHDNMTTAQWFASASEDAVSYATAYMHLSPEEGFVWGVIRTALSSVSKLCIVPMQDYLNLGGEARMNFPGTTGNNWVWRMHPHACTDTLAEKINQLTHLYGRT